jgi:hypothetical protein
LVDANLHTAMMVYPVLAVTPLSGDVTNVPGAYVTTTGNPLMPVPVCHTALLLLFHVQ